MRGAVGADRSLDALNHGHRSARDRELPHIERHGEQNAAERCPVGTYRASLPPETSVLRSAVVNDCTTICALSQLSAVATVAIVNGTHSPPGSTCGLGATSPLLTLAIPVGWPPFADTRRMPLLNCPKTIPSVFQRREHFRFVLKTPEPILVSGD